MSTSKLTRQDIIRNVAYWTRTEKYVDEWLSESDLSRFDTHQMQEQKRMYSNLQAVANTYAAFAIDAYMTGSLKKARPFAEYVALVAEEALRQKSFYLGYWGNRSKLPARLLQAEEAKEEALGRMYTLQLLFYARWLLSGLRDEQLWSQSAEAADELFELSRGKELAIDDLIRTYLEADRPQRAVEVFRKTWRKKKELDMKELTHDAQLNSLAIVAEWQAGNSEVEESARKALEFWYVQSQKWFWDHSDLSWHYRVFWATFRGRYITGITDIELLFQELKGC